MDKEFEKKVKQKRIRTIAVVLVVLAAIVYNVAGTKVEKADYTKSLNKEIETAQTLYEENKDNVGNDKDQYAEYAVLLFAKQIEAAKAVADNEDSVYSEKQHAYETLKNQINEFKDGKNNPVITAEEAVGLASSGETKELTCEIKTDKEITYTIDGGSLDKPTTMNLTAREEGPYYEEINAILAEKKLQGQVISFYQDGSFGGKIQVKTPIYSEKTTQGYAYKVNLEKGTLKFVSEAEIDVDSQTAVFTVKEGGDYVVLTKKMHKDKNTETTVVDEDESETNTQDESVTVEDDTEDSHVDTSDDTEQSTDSKSENQVKDEDKGDTADEQSALPDEEEVSTIKVSIDIRCDTLAADLSKLRDSSLEAYVTSDGCILSLKDVEVEKGSSVYDVLDKVCRDNNIHLEATYTPNYGADYIEGINYLYEFDAGEQSGWMYKVNGVFPNYGCSDYILEDGDSIVWAYTCDMGKDLGN